MVETRTADNVRQARARLAIWDAILAEAEGLYEISAKDFPPIRWLVKDLLPEGTFCLLSGRGKMGKTWLALQLASAVFLGLPFLGNGDRPCGRSGVLFLSLQLSSRQIHDRLEAAGILADNRVQVIHRWPRSDEALEMVRYYVALHPDCNLVVIDMLEQVRDREVQSENSYAENCREIGEWTALTRELGITILGLTHDRKLRSEDLVSAMIGSVGAAGSAGLIWSLKRSRGKADATLSVTGWDIEDQELPLSFELSSGWQLLAGTAAEHRQSEQREAVLSVLRGAEEPLGPRDIADVLEKPPGTVRWLLCALKKDGLVQSPERGKYRVPCPND